MNDRVTDNTDEFRKRWQRAAEATHYTEPLDDITFEEEEEP